MEDIDCYMLNELLEMQDSDESVSAVDLSFDIETTSDNGEYIIMAEYTFSYAEEWDKWLFTEYSEKRADKRNRASNRKWHESRHITWNDINETREIDIPPEVTEKLKEVTGSGSIFIQAPGNMVEKRE